MNQFFQCPFKWKLLHLDHVQAIKVKNEKAELGTNIHEIIAKYYHLISSHPTANKAEKLAWQCFNTYFEPRLESLKKQAVELMENFIHFERSRLNNYIRPLFVEKKLECPGFKGIVDYFDGKHIIDWKTGAMMQIEEDNMRQGKIYEILLKHNGYIKEGQKVQTSFVTLKNGRVLTLPFVTETWLMEQRRKMSFIIKSGRFTKIRSPLCNWCECQIRCEFEGEKLWENVW